MQSIVSDEACCLMCSRIARCKDARASHSCAKFEYTPYPRARTQLAALIGERAAIRSLVKTKEPNMANRPEHPNTAHVKELVANGDIDGVKALLDPDTMPISYLIIAASNLLGDSRAVGAQLSSAPDKRTAVIDMLCQFAAQSSEETPAEQDAEQEPPFTPDEPAQVEEPVEEEKPKKRRRRTKAQIEADNAAQAAESAPVSAPAPVPGFDFEAAFSDTQTAVAALDARIEKIDSGLGEALPQIMSAQADVAKEIAKLGRNLARFRAAFCAFEEELLIAGTIGSAAFNDATESWED